MSKTQSQSKLLPPNAHIDKYTCLWHSARKLPTGILLWLAWEYFFNEILYIGGGEMWKCTHTCRHFFNYLINFSICWTRYFKYIIILDTIMYVKWNLIIRFECSSFKILEVDKNILCEIYQPLEFSRNGLKVSTWNGCGCSKLSFRKDSFAQIISTCQLLRNI